MTAAEIACRFSEPGIDGRNCAAQKGEPCQWLPAGEFHAERQEDAGAMTHTGNPVSAESFTRAVLDSGLLF